MLIRTYGLLGIIGLMIHWLLTKARFPSARLVRFPIHIRGRSHMRLGAGLTTGRHCRLDAFPLAANGPVLFIGKNVQLNDSVHIGAAERVEIGNDVLIASRVFITDHSHGSYDTPDARSAPDVPPAERPIVAKPVVIGDRVWLGEQVMVLPGVSIGAGAIVGANSVVTRDVAPDTIVAGNPAREIRRYSKETGEWARI
ncbi:DapH/DapD/GlmU-related protein [Parerythrobacter aurantius]